MSLTTSSLAMFKPSFKTNKNEDSIYKCTNGWKAAVHCLGAYTFRNAFFMINLTAAACLLGLREIYSVSGLANSVASCFFVYAALLL